MADHHASELPQSPGSITLPIIDDHEYRLITLGNGLRALLVHDATAEKGAAACDVRVGSLSDPDDVPGLAHFTEHMLFYSSHKYPEEDEYSKFIAEHGGHTNAYTAAESTNYHFDCNWDALEPALDRFAQFFISPLISADGVDREANAVDSEHGKNLNSDPWRKLQLWKAVANPAHPFSRFSTGSFDTLITQPKQAGTDPHERVRRFHQEHYSAGLMRLVVVSRHTLDELESLVRDKFAAVPDGGLAPPTFSPDAVAPDQGGLLIRMVPQRDGHSLELQASLGGRARAAGWWGEWPTVAEQQHYRQAPSHYVSHLLGHEGEGSAFALLKARGWATGLVAGEAGTSYSGRSFFMCRIDLTDEGHLARGAGRGSSSVFRWASGLPAGEKRRGCSTTLPADMRFNYRDKQPPYSYASSLSQAMQVYSDADLLLGAYSVPLEYDPDLIRQVVADLTPDKARVLWSSKSLEASSRTLLLRCWWLWQGRCCCMLQLSEWREEAPLPELHLPRPNPYIPKQFGLVEDGAPHPALIHATPMVRLWHKPDPSFKVPKASYVSPEAAVLTQLFAKLLNDYLSEVTYDADLAGLHYGVRATTAGLLLSVYGYSDTLATLAQTVLGKVLGFQVLPDRFQVVKEKAAKDFHNMRYDQPYQYALYCLGVACEERRWHVADYEAALPGLAAQQLEAFYPRLLSRCEAELLAGGNMSAAAATQFAQGLERQLRDRWGLVCSACCTAAVLLPAQRVVRLPRGRPALLAQPGPNPANDNSAVAVSFQVGPDDMRRNALAELVTAIGKRDAFHQLRTVEQLGWVRAWLPAVPAVPAVVGSTAHAAAYLEQRIEAFLPMLAARLADMPAPEFSQHVEELAKSKAERPKRLREAAARDWSEVEQGSLRFDRIDAEVAALRALSQLEVVAFYREHVLEVGSRRKLSVHMEGSRAAEAGAAGSAAPAAEGSGGGATADLAAADAPGEVPAGAGPEGPAVERIGDLAAWKRRQQLYGSLK
ncbi:hypothetical protein CHLNCDRAFT_35384 [Chlorella variabilis]|uniref:Peptidase M16 N-terminal domain-containing protein n=1 Tax=Chlorella variabilis TaxID=554065 RepID=E1ZF51_CHLVA|nr:hypothetical protein CHLNCDRAFT_35384 [Chlorella variabilis]EFN55439.1 hypothetical protein CHLNCDRAFT_35384 [Chlorella variabilis]|eukprot:XP_005847541.1 hypothetical protein CHLNCDRAFT_35384 [Chlorella variabilis]